MSLKELSAYKLFFRSRGCSETMRRTEFDSSIQIHCILYFLTAQIEKRTNRSRPGQYSIEYPQSLVCKPLRQWVQIWHRFPLNSLLFTSINPYFFLPLLMRWITTLNSLMTLGCRKPKPNTLPPRMLFTNQITSSLTHNLIYLDYLPVMTTSKLSKIGLTT